MQASWTVAELAYFAGIIDGEGCIRLGKSKTPKYHSKHVFLTSIQIGNTDPRLMEWIQRRFGGAVRLEGRPKGNRKAIYRWVASGSTISTILTAVLPYLLLKRAQAELMLAYRLTVAPKAIKNRRNKGISYTTNRTDEAIKRQRFDIHAKLSELNKRGIA